MNGNMQIDKFNAVAISSTFIPTPFAGDFFSSNVYLVLTSASHVTSEALDTTLNS